MKKLIAIAAFAAYTACGAQYPLNRVSAVRDMRPVGITEDDANELIRSYDATNLVERISAKQDALEAGENITIEGNVISATRAGGGIPPDYVVVSNKAMNARALDDNVSRVEGYSYGPWDFSDVKAKLGASDGFYLELDTTEGGFVWRLFHTVLSGELGVSPAYAEEADALAAASVPLTLADTSESQATVTRDALRTADPGDSFVTWAYVTNNPVFAGKRGLADNVCRSDSNIYGDWNTEPLHSWAPAGSAFEAASYYDSLKGWRVRVTFENGGRRELARSVEAFASEDDLDEAVVVRMETVPGLQYNTATMRRTVIAVTAVAGETFVTRTFVDATANSVSEAATRYSVMSNVNGYVTLDPNPNKLLFGNGNGNGLSNLVVNILKEYVDGGLLHVTTGGVRMSGWTVTR